jgi:hypothetical protein
LGQISNEGLITLGLAWGGIRLGPDAEKFPDSLNNTRKEFETARRLSIPMATHWASRENTSVGQVEALRAAFSTRTCC